MASLFTGYQSSFADPITLKADRATLHELTLATTRPGYIGGGFATGFTNRAGEIEWTFDVPKEGVYDLSIHYSTHGSKGYELLINDVGYDGTLESSPDRFSASEPFKVFLSAGSNTLKLGRGWGHYDIDSIELTPSDPYAPVKPVPAKLADSEATPQALAVMEKLTSQYGKSTFTGVINNRDRASVESAVRMTPAIMGGDMVEYSLSRVAHGSNAHEEAERLIAASAAGHLITSCWHWNAPTDLIDKEKYVDKDGKEVQAAWYFGFYSRATTFDYADAIDHPDSANYALMLRDIDAIAVQLKKLDDAKVPVLWRPLHESDGKWFWWGTHGPDHFKRLWRLLFDRLVNHHHLHNLIWVYTWSDPAWYPGEDVVDVIGIDAYPKKTNDPLSDKWRDALAHFDGKKLIALSEFGGTPDLTRMYHLGITWSYFASWTGPEGPRKGGVDLLTGTYQSPFAANLHRP